MRNRITINNPILVIGTNANGVLSNDRLLPKKNVFPKQVREAYSIENKENYKHFKKQIADKVNNINVLLKKNHELENLVKRNSNKNIKNIFIQAMKNTTVE